MYVYTFRAGDELEIAVENFQKQFHGSRSEVLRFFAGIGAKYAESAKADELRAQAAELMKKADSISLKQP